MSHREKKNSWVLCPYGNLHEFSRVFPTPLLPLIMSPVLKQFVSMTQAGFE